MHVTYLILAHNNPALLNRLIQSLQHPNCSFYVHIDVKSKDDFSGLSPSENVRFSSRRMDVGWGDLSMVQTVLFCCREIIESFNSDMIVFLSGVDYPVKGAQYIYDYLNRHAHVNFITGVRLPSAGCNWMEHGRRRISCYALRLGRRSIATIEPRSVSVNNLRQLLKVFVHSPKDIGRAVNMWLTYPVRKHPAYLTPFGGEFWWILPKETIEKVLSFLHQHPDFLNFHKDTLCPDEIVMNTLVYNLVDEERICNDCLRFINWKSSPSPYNITMEDGEMVDNCVANPNTLFIRKVGGLDVCDYIDCLVSNNKD